MKSKTNEFIIKKTVFINILKLHDLTQKQFAEKLNVAPKTVNQWIKTDGEEYQKLREIHYQRIKEISELRDEQLIGKEPIQSKSKVDLNLTEQQKNQFKIVQEKYGVTFENIIEAAPLLFMAAANKSLKDQKELINESIISLSAGSNEIIDNIFWETLNCEGKIEINYDEIEKKIKKIIDGYTYQSKNKDENQELYLADNEQIRLSQIVKKEITLFLRAFPNMNANKIADMIAQGQIYLGWMATHNSIYDALRGQIRATIINELHYELDRVNSNKVYSKIGLSPSLDFRKYLTKICNEIPKAMGTTVTISMSNFNGTHYGIIPDILLDKNSYLKNKSPFYLSFYEVFVTSLLKKNIEISYDLSENYIWKEICLEDRNVFELFYPKYDDSFFKNFTISKEFYQQYPYDIYPSLSIEKLPDTFFKNENKYKNIQLLKELSEFKRFDNFGIFHRYENHGLGADGLPFSCGYQICKPEFNQTKSYPFPKWAEICRTIVTSNLEGEIKWFKSEDNGVSWQRLDEDYYKFIGFLEDAMGGPSKSSFLETGCFAKFTDVLKFEYLENDKKVEIIFDENTNIHKKSREIVTEIQSFLRDLYLFEKGEINPKNIKKHFGDNHDKIEGLIKSIYEPYKNKKYKDDIFNGVVPFYILPEEVKKYWKDKIISIVGDGYLSNLKQYGIYRDSESIASLIGNVTINFNKT